MTDGTRRRIATLVPKWETSGEPRRAFARRHGLTVSQFDYWKRQVRRGAAATETAFTPVQVLTTSEAHDGGVIEVRLASGERVTIREGVSVDLVRAVVSALRASC